jgi:hypothetical protein
VTEHLTGGEIKQLANKELKGKAYITALLHLNSCAECRRQLNVPNEEEMMQAIFGDDESPQDDNSKSNQLQTSWKNKQMNWQEKLRNLLRFDGGIFAFSPEFA